MPSTRLERIVERAVKAIEEDLSDRRGISECVGSRAEPPTRRDQRDSWRHIIAKAVAEAIAGK